MIFKNKKIQKIISALLVVVVLSSGLFATPKKSTAFWGVGDVGVDAPANILSQIGDAIYQAGDWVISNAGKIFEGETAGFQAKQWYEVLYKEVLTAIAKRALQEITKSTVNWINSGFHGSPLFLENPQSFFQDIAKSEVKTLVDTFGYDKLKYPFGRDFALNAINSYKTTLQNNTQYTLSKVINDPIYLKNYQNNFNVGGWNGFLINTQYPQNNYVGFQMLATEELARKVQGTVQTASQKVQTALQEGNGFLSPQTCPSNPSYNNGLNEFQRPAFDSTGFDKKFKASHGDMPIPLNIQSPTPEELQAITKWQNDYEKLKALEEGNWSDQNTCPGGLVSTTPGSVVSSQITTALGSNFRSTELGVAMGNSLSAIFDALLNKFLGDGLNSLTSKQNQTNDTDTWNYEGKTLGGPGDGNDWSSYPDEVVVLSDFKNQISGYDIGTCSNIKSSSGDKIDDQEDVSRAQCDAESIPSYEVGTCTVRNSAGDLIEKSEDLTKSTCDLNKANGNTATWLKTKTIPGNNTTWRQNGEWNNKTIDHVKGDLDNTIEEVAMMSNPCDPSDTECLNDNLRTDPITGEYVFRPGILQIINPYMKAVQKLDQCLPGPDKGWEARLKEEEALVGKPFGFETAEQDELKVRAGNAGLKALKFAVNAYTKWLDAKMSTSIDGAVVYLDEIKSIDSIAQQLSELTTNRQDKLRIISRLNNIRNSLAKFTSQPEKGSAKERQLIEIRKQYNAIRSSISSEVTLENARNNLKTMEENYKNVTEKLLPSCLEETGRDANWTIQKEQQKIKQDIQDFCAVPLVSGYSHGQVVRNDEAARENNCPQGDTTDGTGCNSEAFTKSGGPDGGSGIEGWFMFRNPNWTTRPPTIPASGSDLGNEGYEDLPLVNGRNVLGDGDADHINIEINCERIFRANPLDYTQAGNPTL